MPFVYTCRGRAGDILYIGSAEHVDKRIGQHKTKSPWWHLVASVRSSKRYGSMGDAVVAERKAIRKHKPTYNTNGYSGPMKEIRLNANEHNSKKLRRIQALYKRKFSPSKVSLESLANLAIELGSDAAMRKLNIEPSELRVNGS